ncbi:competence protein ComK [Oceanobacillus senegalensis]|uniref:competence protein ComK n=1 Tax=Oceanobacillus senegalensis TaxID=1936063 RepID=UPI0015C435AC|nr:competence protein ComK [Oceanobacillus senegalensis]
MTKILNDYTITPNTMALIPAKEIEYETMVVEQDKWIPVKRTAIELIRSSCQDYLCTYEGRRNAVINRTGFKKKVPIPLYPELNLYIFPSHSIKDQECHWFLYHSILDIKKDYASTSPEQHSIITFMNGTQHRMEVTRYILQKQMKRTLTCIKGLQTIMETITGTDSIIH